MKSITVLYKRHRFSPEIIQYVVWLYHRFSLGHRDIEDLMSQRGILGAHAAVYNLFNLGRHLVSAKNYRYFRSCAFASWEKAVAI